MTTSELRLATKSAATLSARIPKKAMMQDPGDAIVQLTTSNGVRKRHGLLAPPVPLPENSSSSKLHVMPVTSIGDRRHGRSTELQATMRTIETYAVSSGTWPAVSRARVGGRANEEPCIKYQHDGESDRC